MFTKCLSDNTSFRLSDNSLLGAFEIENWVDMPQAIDKNNHLRTDNFAFLLKNESDKEKIKPGDTLRLSDVFVTVVESTYTVSGKIIAVLECGTGTLDINTILTDEKREWFVAKNNLLIGKTNDKELQKRMFDKFWFAYNLEPINYAERPDIGRKLRVTLTGS